MNRLKTLIFKNRSNNLTDESEGSCNSVVTPALNGSSMERSHHDFNVHRKNEKLNLSKIKSSAVKSNI